MVDWRGIGCWDLPGPSRFVERAVSIILVGGHGVVGLVLPFPRPEGLLDAVARRLSEASATLPVRFDASHGLKGRSPVHALAAAAGIGATAIRSVGDFVDAPGLAQAAFIVDGIPPDEWMTWGMFLRAQRAERDRRARAVAPTVCVAVPDGVPPDDVRAAFGGSDLRWLGAVSRLDTQLYAEARAGFPDDGLSARTAVSTIVEMAGWDPALVRALSDLPMEAQIDPREALATASSGAASVLPCWANGLVDHWDGGVHVHTRALLAAGKTAELARRVWRGHVRIVFPFIEQVREAFMTRYEAALRARLPITKTYHTRVVKYSDPFELEPFDIFQLLKGSLPREEEMLLFDCYKLRTSMAHMEPGEVFRIVRASRSWEDLAARFPDGCHAWDWPRCGQRLVLMVGPSGGGKSTWAERNFDSADIVSLDRVREQIFGSVSGAVGDQEPVFRRVRQQAAARLSTGRNAVIDATNLKRPDRLANALLAPPDMRVEYVVVDRPMDEKVATAGWRSGKPGLLDEHAILFGQGLRDILDGDGLPNVRVTNTMKRDNISAAD